MATAGITRAENRQRWRDHIAAWRSSGLTEQDYCAGHDLTLSSFQRWRRIFQREATESVIPPQAGRFVPVNLVSESPIVSGLVLVINDALRIEVSPGFDATTLREVVAALGR